MSSAPKLRTEKSEAGSSGANRRSFNGAFVAALVRRRTAFHWAWVAVLCVLFLSSAGADGSDAKPPDWSAYARAVEFCRGGVRRPLALDFDKRVLCFDGAIWDDLDLSPIGKLDKDGLFVIRSTGGSTFAAMKLADLLRERQATVVVYDYCFSACASYLLVATTET